MLTEKRSEIRMVVNEERKSIIKQAVISLQEMKQKGLWLLFYQKTFQVWVSLKWPVTILLGCGIPQEQTKTVL